MKLKICGMKYNPTEVAKLRPDYLGFIFWEPSKRYFKGAIPNISSDIRKIGVFVDSSLEEILGKIKLNNLYAVQLHGKESPEFCYDLKMADLVSTSIGRHGKRNQIKIIKVFSADNTFDFDQLKGYEEVCDYYLFDTKGKLPGGNGYAFDWKILENYPSSKPYFLSGGIGPEEIDSLKKFKQLPAAKYCHAIDVNSRFEIEPGLKNIEQLKKFKEALWTKNN